MHVRRRPQLSYQYLVNGGGGNTLILDQIAFAVSGIRDYSFGPAGHLEEVAAGANVLDFGADAEGRLSGVNRTAASETAASIYDGRSFLRGAQKTAGGSSSVEPLYESAGIAHALRRRPSPSDPEELVVFLYLAGRPVSQLKIDGAGTEIWTYLITDHLGTPLLVTADAGAVVWESGFEPFGRDFQEGTPAGAIESGVFLRLPGQWEDTSWQDASSGARIYYNVHRWYATQVAAYTRPDPLPFAAALEAYRYSAQRPTALIDPLGLQGTQAFPTNDSFHNACCGEAHRRNLFAATGSQDTGGIVVCCSGSKVPCVLEHTAPPGMKAAGRLASSFR